MASKGLRKDEGIGLGVAIALHALVLWAIVYLKPGDREAIKPPERIEVTISDEVGMTSTAPDPSRQAAPDKGPEIGEPAPAAAAPPEPAPAPQPEPAPAPEPAPRVVEKPQPAPKPEPRPAPKPRPQPRPAPKAPPRKVEKPAPRPAPRKPVQKPAPPKQAATPSRKPSAIDRIVKSPAKPAAGRATGSSANAGSSPNKSATPPRKAGSSAFDDAFKSGTPGARAPAGTGTPAAKIGAQARSALGSAISRQLKPHWQAPQGAEVEQLVTKVRFRLNRDGSLAGDPQVVSTTGQTGANQAQVGRHQEQAIRAVRLAAPFNLPDDLYEGWKVVTTNFDRRLSQ